MARVRWLSSVCSISNAIWFSRFDIKNDPRIRALLPNNTEKSATYFSNDQKAPKGILGSLGSSACDGRNQVDDIPRFGLVVQSHILTVNDNQGFLWINL